VLRRFELALGDTTAALEASPRAAA
jgi:hypothetical protein